MPWYYYLSILNENIVTNAMLPQPCYFKISFFVIIKFSFELLLGFHFQANYERSFS